MAAAETDQIEAVEQTSLGRKETVQISLRRLAVFKAVIDRGGVNAAAAHLGISQPSVTAHLKALERQLGDSLFVRRPGRAHIEMTAAGELLEIYAADALSKSDELEERLSLARGTESQILRIAAQRTLANNDISAVIADILAQYPQSRITLHSETQEVVRRLYNSGETDVAFFFSPADEPASETIGVKRLGFISAPQHPLASLDAIEPRELNKWPFVGGLPDSDYFGLIRVAASKIGVDRMRFVLHVQDSIAVQRAVAGKVGLACTILSSIREDVRAGRLAILNVLGEQPHLAIRCLDRTRGRPQQRLSQLLIAAAREKWAAENNQPS